MKMHHFAVVFVPVTLCLVVSAAADAQPDAYARFPIEEAVEPVGEVPEGVSIDFVADAGVDGGGALRIVNQNQTPVRVMLFEVDGLNAENSTLEYAAMLRSEGLTGMAYLEMWVYLGENSYFSRGIDKHVAGTSQWLACDTPFFLNEPGAVADRAELGVALEGAGTVYIDNVVLAPRAAPGFLAAYGWVAGAALGMMGALFGVLAGVLGPAGKGRGLVLGLGVAILVVCVLMLVGGVAVWLSGGDWALFYPLVLAGGIGTLLFAFMLPITAARYRQAETRRLAAADMAGREER